MINMEDIERKRTPEQLANIRKWVDALRSGEYRQMRDALRKKLPDHEREDDDPVYGFCCLGVACDLGLAEPPVMEHSLGQLPMLASMMKSMGFQGSTVYIARHILNGLGVEGVIDYVTEWIPVDHMNDESFTFEQIADAIEKQYLDNPQIADTEE